MSRIGKLPIHIPQGVTVAVSPDNTVTVKGPKGQLSQQVSADLTVTVEENEVHVARHTEDKEHKAQHGLYRALLHNMVVGVSEGYTIKQELVGVGFVLTLRVRFSNWDWDILTLSSCNYRQR